MLASCNGHTDIARMLAGEYNAIVDMRSAVRASVTLPLCVVTACMVVVFGTAIGTVIDINFSI